MNLLATANSRRADREAQAAGTHTPSEWRAKLESQAFLCFWCGRRLIDASGKSRATKDHLTPLSRGGSNSIENIVGACKPCNCKKHSRTAEEYRSHLKANGIRISAICTLPASTRELVFARNLPSEVKQFTDPLTAASKFPVRPDHYWPERRAFLRWQVATLTKGESATMALMGVEVKKA